MASEHSTEQLNFWKLGRIVFSEFPRILNETLLHLWEKKFGPSSWDGSEAVRTKFVDSIQNKEDRHTSLSIEDWDTSLWIHAILSSDLLSRNKQTLRQNYLSTQLINADLDQFHALPANSSSKKDQFMKITLAINQLRLIRNDFCHLSRAAIPKASFDKDIGRVIAAFNALNARTLTVENICEEKGFMPHEIKAQLEEYSRKLATGSLDTRVTESKEAKSCEEPWKKCSVVHRGKFKKFTDIGPGCEYPKIIELKAKKSSDDIASDDEVMTKVRVCCAEDFLIGKGCDGTCVFIGLTSDGYERAVKCISKLTCLDLVTNENEISTTLRRVKSNNIVKYWFIDNSDYQTAYIVMDLCEETLEDYVEKESQEVLTNAAPGIMRQILQGLCDLHQLSEPILHRDLKPANVMRNVDGKWLLADFGLSRTLPEGKSTHNSSQKGTKHWRAAESYPAKGKQFAKVRFKKESDIQTAGMLAFNILTKDHPFGQEHDRESNLLDGNAVALSTLENPVARHMISLMLEHEPENRPSAEQVLQHFYLLSPDEQFRMLARIGNEEKINEEGNRCSVVEKLNEHPLLIEQRWKKKINSKMLEYLTKRDDRIYDDQWTGCLQLIRDISDLLNDSSSPSLQLLSEIKKTLGNPQNYLVKTFPDLPVAVYDIVRDSSDCNCCRAFKQIFPRKSAENDNSVDGATEYSETSATESKNAKSGGVTGSLDTSVTESKEAKSCEATESFQTSITESQKAKSGEVCSCTSMGTGMRTRPNEAFEEVPHVFPVVVNDESYRKKGKRQVASAFLYRDHLVSWCSEEGPICLMVSHDGESVKEICLRRLEKVPEIVKTLTEEIKTNLEYLVIAKPPIDLVGKQFHVSSDDKIGTTLYMASDRALCETCSGLLLSRASRKYKVERDNEQEGKDKYVGKNANEFKGSPNGAAVVNKNKELIGLITEKSITSKKKRFMGKKEVEVLSLLSRQQLDKVFKS